MLRLFKLNDGDTRIKLPNEFFGHIFSYLPFAYHDIFLVRNLKDFQELSVLMLEVNTITISGVFHYCFSS